MPLFRRVYEGAPAIRPEARVAHIPVVAIPVPARPVVGRMVLVAVEASVAVALADDFNKRFLN